MQILTKMNAKMDQGYKLTNFSCNFCSGVTLTRPNTNGQNPQGLVYCPKCNKQYIPVKNQQQQQNDNTDDVQQDNQQEYYNQIYKDQKINKNMVVSGSGPSVLQSSSHNTKNTNIANKPSKQNIMLASNTKVPTNTRPTQQHLQQQQQIDAIEQQYEQFLQMYNSTVKTPQQMKSQQVSKKIGEKLISGWAMMEQACLDCNVPLMKSKKGNLICCGCQRDYSVVKSNGKDNTKNQDREKDRDNKLNNNSTKNKNNTDDNKPANITNKSPQTSTLNLNNNNSNKNKQDINPQEQSSKKQNTNSQQQQQQQSVKITKIVSTTLEFLQNKLEQAIQMNDLQAVDRVLRSVKLAKDLL